MVDIAELGEEICDSRCDQDRLLADTLKTHDELRLKVWAPVVSTERRWKGVCGCRNTFVGITEEESFVSDGSEVYSVLCLSIFHTSMDDLCTAFVIDLIEEMLRRVSFLKHRTR